jgi:hypothetical protein
MGIERTTVGARGPTVLEDPTGRRARWMRRAGRLVFVVFLAWLLAIVAGGLGLTPVPGIPFTHALRPSSGPPPLVKLPRPRPPTASDLRPALSAAAFAALARAGQTVGSPGRSASAPGQSRVPPGQSSLAPGQTKTTPVGSVTRGHSTTAPGQTKTAPGQTKTAPGQTKTAPGHTKTTPAGRSTTAPGRTTTTTKSRRP